MWFIFKDEWWWVWRCLPARGAVAPRPRPALANASATNICEKHYLASATRNIWHLQQKYLTSTSRKGKHLATRNVLSPFSQSLDRQQEIFVTRPESLQVQNRKYASSYQLIDASAELIISEIKFQWLNPWPCCYNILWAKQTGMVWLRGIGKVR